jgi:hypothetical protein
MELQCFKKREKDFFFFLALFSLCSFVVVVSLFKKLNYLSFLFLVQGALLQTRKKSIFNLKI